MLIIAGHLTVEPADRDAYVSDCARAVTPARRAQGCLDYALTADMLDLSRVNVYELGRLATTQQRTQGARRGPR